MLNRETILAANDLPIETINVAEWGGPVSVRTMSGIERDSFDAEIADEEAGNENFRSRLLVRCIVDDKGNRLFSDADANALGAKSALVVSRLFEVAKRLNGIGVDAVEADVKN